MAANDIIDWIDSVLTPDRRANIERQVLAGAANAVPLVKQLQALRAQLRENAYQKIYEARANVADDLLKLTQSLTQLIHFSNVAGEDTSAYISLLRSVSSVTQKLSFFGEDDADGDGVKDDQEGEQTNPAEDLSLDIDDGSKKVVAPEHEQPAAEEDQATEDENIDPDSVQPSDAETEGEQPSEDGEAPAEEGGEETEMTDDESDEGDDQQPSAEDDFSSDFEKAVKDMPKEKKAAPKEEASAEEPAADEGEESTEEEPASDEDEEDPEKKKGFLAKLDEKTKDGEEQTAESSARVLSAAENKFRFAYLGLSPDKQKVRALVTDYFYSYKPSAALFGGDAKRLDIALRKILVNNPGYSALLTKLNELVKDKKLSIVSRKEVDRSTLKGALESEADKGQLGHIDVDADTAWRYRGVGLQKVRNSEAAIWFEVGSKEYAAVPGDKALKPNEDIEDFDARIKAQLAKLSYSDGLEFIVGLVKRGSLKPVFVGAIS